MRLSTFKFYFQVSLLGLSSFLWNGCSTKEDTKPTVTLPVLAATTSVTDITGTTASSGGTVTSDGGATVTVRGVCYGKNSSPTIDINSFTTNGSGLGQYGSALTGLTPATKYFVRAYATNIKGTNYGEEVNFTSAAAADIPTVTTTGSVSAITNTTAVSGGDVTSDGGFAITARGVCWNTAGSPTIVLSTKTTNGTGTGSFTSNITGLTLSTNYKVRAYATNANGKTGYGAEVSFTTSGIMVTPPSLGPTSAVTNITTTSGTSGGSITSENNASITDKGICWGTASNPTIALATKISKGAGLASFTADITNLSPNTLYHVRAYATNSAGTGYGTDITFTTDAVAGPITDIDGNTYQTLKIGTQTWMTENLKTSKYKDGTVMADLNSPTWTNTTSGAFEVFDNTKYGKLYNFYAVVDVRGLCPAGWHVPSDAEWTTLVDYLGGNVVAGGKMKSTSTLWASPNNGATNSSGFSGLPGGYMNLQCLPTNNPWRGHWWSKDQTNASSAWSRYLDNSNTEVFRAEYDKNFGMSIRCVKDL